MNCHNCKNKRPADAAFCPTCGASTVDAQGELRSFIDADRARLDSLVDSNGIGRDNCAAKFITYEQNAGATLVLQ